MGASSRRKGATGERAAEDLLRANGWGKTVCLRRSAGEAGCDIVIDDPEGVLHSVEVKTVASLTPAHLKQARTNGSKERRRWALMWFPTHYGTAHRQALLLRHKAGEATPAWEIIAD